MKRAKLLGIGAVALIATVPFLGRTPVWANLQQVGENIVQAINRPEVRLNLVASKQITEVNEEGVQLVSWKALDNGAVVMPGDVIRYTVNSANIGDLPASNLVVTQPIPQKTVYELGSAKSNNGAEVTYSIDSGKTFVAQPMVAATLENGAVVKRPAPAEAYTHIRWQFGKDLDPAAGVKAIYDVRIPQ